MPETKEKKTLEEKERIYIRGQWWWIKGEKYRLHMYIFSGSAFYWI